MVTFSVKNIQVGHNKNINNENKFDGRKNIFFVLNTAKKKPLVINTGWTQKEQKIKDAK